jgi:UDP-2,3-diacylglucosamine pyrophosphatase LpxH
MTTLPSEHRCVLLSDVHLGPDARPELSRSLCELVVAHPEHELIFLGDTFEFSAVVDPDPEQAWQVIRSENLDAVEALRAHVQRGGLLTFVAGNHDAVLPALRERFGAEFGAMERVCIVPWFTRRGGVHLEHGNLWDRDNAPLHPLAEWSSKTEPLGVALMRRFCAARGASQFAHAHQTTPAGGVLRAFRLFGFRAPYVIVRYFGTAVALCVEALVLRPTQLRRARLEGSARVLELEAQLALAPSVLGTLLAAAPEPTHRRFSTTFMRLYFDRVLAGLACVTALLSVGTLGPASAGGLFVLGVGYLFWGARGGVARYPGPVDALAEGSRGVASGLGAEIVVFGHTHVEQWESDYVNLGSFAYSRGSGRPYAVIEEGRLSSRRWPKSSAAVEPRFT